MKKILLSNCLLAAGLLAAMQFTAIARGADLGKICPSLNEISNLPLKTVVSGANKERFNVTAEGYLSNDDTSSLSYTYRNYSFSVNGLKGKDAEHILTTVKNALANAAAKHPEAERIEPAASSFRCHYLLDPADFSQAEVDYHDVYPDAVAEINSTDTQNLYAIPKKLNIS